MNCNRLLPAFLLISTLPVLADSPSSQQQQQNKGAAADDAKATSIPAEDLQPPRVLYLEHSVSNWAGRLPSEFVRQAILAVASEDFDIVIRDASLGEEAPADVPGGAILDVQDTLTTSRSTEVRLIAKRHNDGQWFEKKRVRFDLKFDTTKLPRALELSDDRISPGLEETLREAVEAVRDVGAFLRDHDVPARQTTDATHQDSSEVSDVALRLREMSVASQFQAVRATSLLPPSAEKERLLAIGYANLALLTQHQWSVSSKVFAARALVYAERAARKEPGDAAHEVQAYALALVGLPAAALEHAKLVASDHSPRLQAIEAFCEFRDAPLTALRESSPEVAQLAALLECLVVEWTDDSDRIAETYATLLEVCPNAWRGFEPAVTSHELGLLHQVTAYGPSYLLQSFAQEVKRLPNLPPSVRSVIADEATLPADLANALAAANTHDDAAQPTWQTLGRLIRDEALLESHRRLWFVTSALGLSAAEEYPGLRQMVGEHPYADLALEPFSPTPDADRIKAAAKSIVTRAADLSKTLSYELKPDVGPRHKPLIELTESLGLNDLLPQYAFAVRTHADRTRDDLKEVAELEREIHETFNNGDTLASLSEISPNDLYVALWRMRSTTAASPDQLAAWEKEFSDRPSMLIPLAYAYAAAKRNEDAIRIATRATELRPSFRGYLTLARMEGRARHTPRQIAAYEKSLEYPSYGLASTDVHLTLGRYYLREQDPEAARPHAEAAAESYAFRGIRFAISFYTETKEWDTAEQWVVRLSERYPESSWGMWYCWCVATGHGHLEQAKEYNDAVIKALRDKPMEKLSESELIALALYETLQGDDRAAADYREFLARRGKLPAEANIAAVLHLRSGRRDHAVGLLAEASTWTESNPQAKDAAGRSKIFHDALVAGKPLPTKTIHEFQKAIRTWPSHEHITWDTYFGEMFIELGNREEGLKMLEGAAAKWLSSDQFNMNDIVPVFWVREHKHEAGLAKPE